MNALQFLDHLLEQLCYQQRENCTFEFVWGSALQFFSIHGISVDLVSGPHTTLQLLKASHSIRFYNSVDCTELPLNGGEAERRVQANNFCFLVVPSEAVRKFFLFSGMDVSLSLSEEKVFALIVSKGRSGILQPEIAQFLSMDAKTIFYLTKILVGYNVVKKYTSYHRKQRQNLFLFAKFDLEEHLVAAEAIMPGVPLDVGEVLLAIGEAPVGIFALYQKAYQSLYNYATFRALIFQMNQSIEAFVVYDDTNEPRFAIRRVEGSKATVDGAEQMQRHSLHAGVPFIADLIYLLERSPDGLLSNQICDSLSIRRKEMEALQSLLFSKSPNGAALISVESESFGKEHRFRFRLAAPVLESLSAANYFRSTWQPKMPNSTESGVICINYRLKVIADYLEEVQICETGLSLDNAIRNRLPQRFKICRKTIIRDLKHLEASGDISLQPIPDVYTRYLIIHKSVNTESPDYSERISNYVEESASKRRTHDQQLEKTTKISTQRSTSALKAIRYLMPMNYISIIPTAYGFIFPLVDRLKVIHRYLWETFTRGKPCPLSFDLNAHFMDGAVPIGVFFKLVRVVDFEPELVLIATDPQRCMLPLSHLSRDLFSLCIGKIREKVTKYRILLTTLGLISSSKKLYSICPTVPATFFGELSGTKISNCDEFSEFWKMLQAALRSYTESAQSNADAIYKELADDRCWKESNSVLIAKKLNPYVNYRDRSTPICNQRKLEAISVETSLPMYRLKPFFSNWEYRIFGNERMPLADQESLNVADDFPISELVQRLLPSDSTAPTPTISCRISGWTRQRDLLLLKAGIVIRDILNTTPIIRGCWGELGQVFENNCDSLFLRRRFNVLAKFYRRACKSILHNWNSLKVDIFNQQIIPTNCRNLTLPCLLRALAELNDRFPLELPLEVDDSGSARPTKTVTGVEVQSEQSLFTFLQSFPPTTLKELSPCTKAEDSFENCNYKMSRFLYQKLKIFKHLPPAVVQDPPCVEYIRKAIYWKLFYPNFALSNEQLRSFPSHEIAIAEERLSAIETIKVPSKGKQSIHQYVPSEKLRILIQSNSNTYNHQAVAPLLRPIDKFSCTKHVFQLLDSLTSNALSIRPFGANLLISVNQDTSAIILSFDALAPGSCWSAPEGSSAINKRLVYCFVNYALDEIWRMPKISLPNLFQKFQILIGWDDFNLLVQFLVHNQLVAQQSLNGATFLSLAHYPPNVQW